MSSAESCSWCGRPVVSMAASRSMKARPRAQRFVVRAGREVGELVVVALVAEGCGVLRLVAELVLPDVVEETIEFARAGGDVLVEILRGTAAGVGAGAARSWAESRERGRCAEQ